MKPDAATPRGTEPDFSVFGDEAGFCREVWCAPSAVKFERDDQGWSLSWVQRGQPWRIWSAEAEQAVSAFAMTAEMVRKGVFEGLAL